jgi:outer membrane murein-binding lipoprotein Lpp
MTLHQAMENRLRFIAQDVSNLKAQNASEQGGSLNARVERLEKEQNVAAWFRQEILFGLRAMQTKV